MKRRFTPLLLGLALLFALSSAGCAPSPAPSPEMDKIQAERTPLSQNLGLSNHQSYTICDVENQHLLLVTYDTEKQNPSEGGRDQANSTYYYNFVQYDLNTQSVLKTFPIEQFGFIASAAFAFDGFVYSYMVETEPKAWDTTLFYQPTLKGQEKQIITVGNPALTPFNTVPVLSRWGNGVALGYDTNNEMLDVISSEFKTIQSDRSVSPLMSFLWDVREDEEWITADFRTSDTHLAYPVDRNGQVVFYIIQMGQEPVQIALPKGEKLYAFAITDNQLLVSRTNQTAGGTFCIEQLDLTGTSLEIYETREPMNDICINGDLFCAFGAHTPLGVFSLRNGAIEPIPVDTTFLSSTWNFALPDGDGFILASHLPEEYPEIWRISVKTSQATPSPS